MPLVLPDGLLGAAGSPRRALPGSSPNSPTWGTTDDGADLGRGDRTYGRRRAALYRSWADCESADCTAKRWRLRRNSPGGGELGIQVRGLLPPATHAVRARHPNRARRAFRRLARSEERRGGKGGAGTGSKE